MSSQNYISTILVATAATVGGIELYDIYTPPAATWLQEIQVAPIQSKETSPDGFVYSKVESDPLPLKSNSVTVDLIGTGPPKQDDYPRSPQEAAALEANPQTSLNHTTQFGYLK